MSLSKNLTGRKGYLSPYRNQIEQPLDTGIRSGLKIDFVGHLWCFKKDWLYFMFGTKPYTYDTGEDMHLCYSANVHGGIESYVQSPGVFFATPIAITSRKDVKRRYLPPTASALMQTRQLSSR